MRATASAVLRILAVVLVSASGPAARADEVSARTLEYPVKAAFLYQFARFVEWPAGPATSAFCIGVLGEDPFGPALDRAVEGKAVAGRPLVVRRSHKLEDLEPCPLLFVGHLQTERLEAVLARTARLPILTVGESEDFARAGGMVRFFREGNHVRFDINLPAAQEAGLQLSSRQLAIAYLTGSRPGDR